MDGAVVYVVEVDGVPCHQFWEPANRHADAHRMAVDAATGIAASGRDAFVFRVELRLGERHSIVSTSHRIYFGKAKAAATPAAPSAS